jgi:acetyl-CoA C-acetyltransferase
MKNVYIVAALRTPIGKFGGAFAEYGPVELGGFAMKAALEKAGISGENLDLYIYGNVLRAGHGQLIPRQAAFKAGIPKEVDGFAVDMVCSSGMLSIMNAATQIRAGEAEIVLAGGTESMTNTGFFLSSKARWGYKYGAEPLQDLLQRDGLGDAFSHDPMGNLTERLAAENGISRADVDEVAAMSNQRAAQATADGAFANEIIPVSYKVKRETKVLTADEGFRADTTLESLGALRPAFSKDGVLTAGNSSQISDGAVAVILASEEAVAKYGLKPIAKFEVAAISAGEPYAFAEAPVPAVKRILERTGRTIDDYDLIENNEAFAVNSVLFNRKLGISYDKLNVHGGAIALGHPIGASGARIVTTLIHALHRHDKQLGLASICHGTGGGTAVSVERV